MGKDRPTVLILSPWSNEWNENVPNPTNRIIFKHLIEQGFELDVIQPGPCSGIPSSRLRCHSLGMSPHLKPGRVSHLWSFFSYGLRFYRLGLKLLKTKKIDIVYGFSGKTAIPTFLLSRRFKIPSVIKLFGILYFSRGNKNLRDALLNLEHYLGYRVPVDLLMVINDGTGGDKVAARMGIGNRFVFVPNPRPQWNPVENAKEALGIPKNRKVVLYVSRLDILKGVEILPDIMHILRGEIPEILFLIVGEGPMERHLLRRIDELNLSDFVRYAGYVRHSELQLYYSASDLFLGIAEYSNATLPVIEALSMGVPVVAFDTGHTREVIPDGSGIVYVPFKNINVLVEKIVDILINPEERQRLSLAALEFSRTIPTWKEVAEAEANMLRKLITK